MGFKSGVNRSIGGMKKNVKATRIVIRTRLAE